MRKLNGDPAFVAFDVFEPDGDPGPIGSQGKAFRPLDDDHGRGRKGVFERKGLNIMKALDAIKVHVVDADVIAEDVNESKGGAGDLLFSCGTQSADDAFRDRGPAAAQFAGQEDQHRRAKPGG